MTLLSGKGRLDVVTLIGGLEDGWVGGCAVGIGRSPDLFARFLKQI